MRAKNERFNHQILLHMKKRITTISCKYWTKTNHADIMGLMLQKSSASLVFGLIARHL
jgi:mannosyltransferase OCH1-like enzyme